MFLSGLADALLSLAGEFSVSLQLSLFIDFLTAGTWIGIGIGKGCLGASLVFGVLFYIWHRHAQTVAAASQHPQWPKKLGVHALINSFHTGPICDK